MKPMTAKPMATALQMCKYSGGRKHVRDKIYVYSRSSDLFAWALCTVSRTADHVSSGRSFSFGVAKTDLVSITDELLGNLNEFLDLVGHID